MRCRLETTRCILPRSVIAGLFFVVGCTASTPLSDQSVTRIHPLQAPIDPQASAVVEVVSAVWGDGVDVRTVTRETVEEALRGAQLFRSVGALGEGSRYLIRVELHQRVPIGRSPRETEAAISVLDRQRNEVTAAFRIRDIGASDDPRRAALAVSRTVVDLLREPVDRD